MLVDPSDYHQVPENRHGIQAGTILLPTAIPIVAGGGTSGDFVRQQGGNDETFVFLFGVRTVRNILGVEVEILEGVFLDEDGPGFRPTWDYDQLMREADLGGWKVISTDEVVDSWVERVEARMNRRS